MTAGDVVFGFGAAVTVVIGLLAGFFCLRCLGMAAVLWLTPRDRWMFLAMAAWLLLGCLLMALLLVEALL